MTIDVVTVYSPRPGHEKFLDFLPMIDWQRRTAEKFGHNHVVVSDWKLEGFNVHNVELPAALMTAILVGQIAYLEAWDGKHPVLMVDADCLIARDLKDAFTGDFDLGLTNREDLKAPINNGAMYIAPGNKPAVLAFFNLALGLCKKHWGGDQEAISQAAAPVPENHCIQVRNGLRISFLSMRTHNVVPRAPGLKHKSSKPFVVHFKGMERKPWMEIYARQFILGNAHGR